MCAFSFCLNGPVTPSYSLAGAQPDRDVCRAHNASHLLRSRLKHSI
jgi:hypothetical protein